jgi:hypothetical protein
MFSLHIQLAVFLGREVDQGEDLQTLCSVFQLRPSARRYIGAHPPVSKATAISSQSSFAMSHALQNSWIMWELKEKQQSSEVSAVGQFHAGAGQ